MTWVESREILCNMLKEEEIEIWFADETEIGRQIRETHINRAAALKLGIQAIKREMYGKDQGD